MSVQKRTDRDQARRPLIEQLFHKKIIPPAFTELWVETRFTYTNEVAASKKEKVTFQHPQQGDIITDKITGMEFVYIPEGCFMMGSSPDDEDHQKDEGPVHEVCLSAFWMGKYPVTQGQWKKIMGDNPAKFKKGDNYPVEKVSWNDAQKFITKLNKKSGKKFRLPTEAEWEYACRAKSSYTYSGGDNLDAVAWHNGNSGGTTHSVGQKKSNDFGLYDMSGNVWEWCADWHREGYHNFSCKNPIGPVSGKRRILRGGSRISSSMDCRLVSRLAYCSTSFHGTFGFRIVLPV